MTSGHNHNAKQTSKVSSVAKDAKQPLPSRSEVQRNRKRKNKKRRKQIPLITWLAIFFIFMPIVIFLLVSNFQKIQLPFLTDSASGYETVKFSTKNEENDQSNSTSANTEDSEEEAKSDESNDQVVQHIVQSGETIYSISMKYYQSKDGMDLIREWNSLEGNEILVGQVLKIPLEK